MLAFTLKLTLLWNCSAHTREEKSKSWCFVQLLIQLEAVSRASIGNETNHMMLTADDAIRMTTGITL